MIQLSILKITEYMENIFTNKYKKACSRLKINFTCVIYADNIESTVKKTFNK